MEKLTVKIRRVQGAPIITGIPVVRKGRKVGVEFSPEKSEFDVDADIAAAAVARKVDVQRTAEDGTVTVEKTAVFEVADSNGVTRLGNQQVQQPPRVVEPEAQE